ncbi:mitochondrial carrier domain-containing protein [Radiomyces spectabilis]|uniref:mitochondrial carrier domain-containing protein n=1 Tax=Radiomyces spectabilis TaxID=64574 RepID=UPI00221F538B|nr:mitochondrial carrier domain-containing protein [Radiomyces spectabilis]KAI8377605.1 mitochondrial carrier domain-containing protein [Radiomyces spectabilis]
MTSDNLRKEPLLNVADVGGETLMQAQEHQPDVWKQLLWSNRTVVAASSAAVTSVLAGFPFDSVKTRMQTHHYDSILDCVRKTYQEEGARGFFRGMIPPLVTVSIIKSVSFSVYEGTKQKLKSHGLHGDTLPSLIGLATLSGAASGAFTAMLSCPLELVKIQRQLEQVMLASRLASGQPVESSSWNAAKQIVRRKGVFGLWSGLGCHSVRDTIGTSIYFGGYETAKRLLTSPESSPGPLTHFMAGGFCGILSWLIVFPFDVCKSIMQKDVMMTHPKYNSARECATALLRHGGVRGLYRGLSVTLIRAFPIHSLNFLVYEQVLRLIPSSPTH